MSSSNGAPIGEPVWQDVATYGYTETLSHDGWAWEFLRRNPLYRFQWHCSRDPSMRRSQSGDAGKWGLLTFCRAGGDGARLLVP